LKAYLITVNPYYQQLMSEAEKRESPIDPANYANDGTLSKQEMLYLAADLVQILLSYTEGDAASSLQYYLESTNDGFELWRRLHKDYAQREKDQARRLLQQIMLFRWDELDFQSNLNKWESMVAKYERITASRLSEEVKISSIMRAAQGPLADHLTLNADHYTDFQSVRARIREYYASKATRDEDLHVNAVGYQRHYGNWDRRGNNNYRDNNYRSNNYRGNNNNSNYQYSNYYNNQGNNNYSGQKGKKGKGKGKNQQGKGKKGQGKGNYKGQGKGKGKKGKPKGKGRGKGKNNYQGRSNYREQGHGTVPMEIGAVDYYEEEMYDNYTGYDGDEGYYETWDDYEYDDNHVAAVSSEQYYDDSSEWWAAEDAWDYSDWRGTIRQMKLLSILRKALT
jgi:hypothetical protein